MCVLVLMGVWDLSARANEPDIDDSTNYDNNSVSKLYNFKNDITNWYTYQKSTPKN